MRTLQDYIDKYNEVADNLGYTGESVELLVQLLANASYIGEVENITYMQEASLEKSASINSKIQHCMDSMYSVFRGQCPRLVMKIKPTRYISLNPYDQIIQGFKFGVYYLGYYQITGDSDKSGTDSKDGDGKFIYGSATFAPSLADETYIIICLIAPEVKTIDKTINSSNTYYVDCTEENLSNDVFVKINGDVAGVTRTFAEHVLEPNKYLFDLTIPSFGSRLYVANYFGETPLSRQDEIGITPNTRVEASYYVYSHLSDYNQVDLTRLVLQGCELLDFEESWLTKMKYTQLSRGLCFIEEVDRNDINTIHYKANRDRFVNSILRSNSDIGTVLEETFPDIVKQDGTVAEFALASSNSSSYNLTIYYIPQDQNILLTAEQIESFRKEKVAYYVVNDINIQKGTLYNARINIEVEMYQSQDISTEIEDILMTYGEKFGVVFDTDTKSEITSLISKISNIKRIVEFDIEYYDENRSPIKEDQINTKSAYFSISPTITLITAT